MKILVVYYSRTGITKKVAERIASALGADKEEIIDKSNRSGVMGYLRSGKEAVKKILADIEPVKIDPSAYDLVIIGTPVWAATMSSPVRSYLTTQKGKIPRVAFFATQGGEGASRAIEQMAELAALPAKAGLAVMTKEVVRDDYQAKLEKFISELND